jgi:hypothetical protein
MIDMRVGENAGLDVGRIEREAGVSLERFLAPPLE